jgi:16S rRNA (cytosine967-C5)-methyltransferase
MSRYYSYLNSAVQIVTQYSGQEPFAAFIKKYFSGHEKYGSNDRKHISHLCYCYFRLGIAFPEKSTEEKMLIGLFLCSTQHNEILEQLRPALDEKIHLPLEGNVQCSMFNTQCSIYFRSQKN